MASTPGVDLKAYEIDVVEFSNQLQIGVAQLTRRLAFEIFRRLIRVTPVDTGRLRFGWNMEVGRPDFTAPGPGVYPTAPKVPQLSGLDFRRKAGVDLAKQTGGLPPVVYITNGVPYLIFLEEGTPFIAPRKFVESTALGVQNTIRSLVPRV